MPHSEFVMCILCLQSFFRLYLPTQPLCNVNKVGMIDFITEETSEASYARYAVSS